MRYTSAHTAERPCAPFYDSLADEGGQRAEGLMAYLGSNRNQVHSWLTCMETLLRFDRQP